MNASPSSSVILPTLASNLSSAPASSGTPADMYSNNKLLNLVSCMKLERFGFVGSRVEPAPETATASLIRPLESTPLIPA